MSFYQKSISWLMMLTCLLAACSPVAAPATSVSMLSLAATITPTPLPATITPIPATPASTGAVSASISAITHVTVIDVENGVAIPGQTVLVVGERIERIGAQDTVDLPPGAQTIDGRGRYLIPGLVDAHVHYSDAPITGRLMLANGVLLVRDMGNPNDYILPLRDALNRGATLGPEMVASGAMLDGNPPVIPYIAVGVDTPEQARVVVDRQAAAGVDMIKVYSLLPPDALRAAVAQAQKHGLTVVGHVPDAMTIEDAAAAGLKSSEHPYGFDKVIARLLGEPLKPGFASMGVGYDYLHRLGEVDPQALQQVYHQLRDSGLTVCPTVVTFKNFPNIGAFQAESLAHGEYIPPALLESWKTQWAGQSAPEAWIWQNWVQMVRGLNQAGVPLMVGTDLAVPGVIPGFAVHEEMAIWQDAGIPAAEVLRSATWVPAQLMGQGDRLGSLGQGMAASMVLLRANPLEDVRNAQQIESVFLRGRYFSREELDQLLSEAKALAQPSSAPAVSPTALAPAAAAPTTAFARYAFPQAIDPAKRYLFYLHGKIIEDQGIQAVSPDFGPYEYGAILERLGQPGFIVISEPRPKNTDGQRYAAKVVEQAEQLLKAGVPAKNITVAGASKGAGIAVEVSNLLRNEAVNYVLLSICHPDTVAAFKQNGTTLSGNVLSIYDSVDSLAGSCQELFAFSQGKGLSRSKEIVLNVGTGHGILYKPLDEWVLPLIQWAENP